VTAGLHGHWLWRAFLIIVGMASYFEAVLVMGIGLVRYVGIPRNESRRLRKHTHSLFLSATPCVRGRTLESDWNPTGVAICPASNGGSTVRASVVEVLHSERNRSQATIR